MLKKTIAIDMDGVLADTETHFLNWYFEAYGVKVPYDQLIGKPEGEGFPEKDAVKKFVLTNGFLRTLPVMPGAVKAVSELTNVYDIYIVSAAMEFPQSLSEKREWITEFFPFIAWTNIVFCGNKSIINADYMIDDHDRNLSRFKGVPILFNAAHNIHVNKYLRVKSWDEILILLMNQDKIIKQ